MVLSLQRHSFQQAVTIRSSFQKHNLIFPDRTSTLETATFVDRHPTNTQYATTNMAAILCKPIGALCEFLFTAPCKACSGCCSLCSDGIYAFCKNPLAAFLFVTCAFQIPLGIIAAIQVPGIVNGCKGSQWLVGMLGCAIAHIFTSFYLAGRVVNRTDEALRDINTSWLRIKYLLCHDCWMAIYLLIVAFYVVWLFVGSTWLFGNSFNDCDESIRSSVFTVLGIGWAFLFIGPAVLSCNLCCACCDNWDYAGTDADFAAADAAKKAKKKQSATASNNASGYGNDVENPAEPMTYSTDGIPIADNAGEPVVVEAEVVVEGEDLPPAMKPPPSTKGGNSKAEKAMAMGEKAAAKAQETANEAVKKFGTWYGNKKKKGSDLPDQKASLY